VKVFAVIRDAGSAALALAQEQRRAEAAAITAGVGFIFQDLSGFFV
jgi:hypothetical protein